MTKVANIYCRHTALLLCLFALLLPSCKDDRKDLSWRDQGFVLDEELVRNSRDSVDFILSKAMAHNRRFSTFAANVDINMKAEDVSIGFGGQLRVQKDRIFWMNCQKLVWEIFRMKMTPDSLAFYSKAGNMAFVYAGDSAQHFLSQSFSLLQSLFLRQVDSVMFKGKRSLAGDAKNWIIQGIPSDSVAWQVMIDRENFKTNGFDIQVRDSTVFQIAMLYHEEKGFSLRLSENGNLMVAAQVIYKKPRWDEDISFPFSIPRGVKLLDRGLLKNLKQGPNNGMNPQ